MQGHQSSDPRNAETVVSRLHDCVIAASNWCASKRLQLNAKKTEVLWFGKAVGLRKVDPAGRYVSLSVLTSFNQSIDEVPDLGVYFDAHLSMKAHDCGSSLELPAARSCFYHLRRPSTLDTTQSWTRRDREIGIRLCHFKAGLL